MVNLFSGEAARDQDDGGNELLGEELGARRRGVPLNKNPDRNPGRCPLEGMNEHDGQESDMVLLQQGREVSQCVLRWSRRTRRVHLGKALRCILSRPMQGVFLRGS